MGKIQKLIVEIILLLVFLIPSIFNAQPTAVNNGLSWLRANQNEDGSWGEKPTSVTTPFHSTCTVANTLHYLDISNAAYSNAIQWIIDQEVISNRYLSWKIEILANSGTNVSRLVNPLVSYQNSNGGWGIYPGYESGILDTTLALQALRAASYSDKEVIEKAVRYLLSQQDRDGGWGLGTVSSGQEAEGSVYLTSLVLLVLDGYKEEYNLHSWLYDGVLWLAGQQNQDGGFGRDGSGQGAESSVWETALAYQALINSPQSTVHGPQLVKALEYIEKSQKENGSWNDDAFTTALALRALKDSAPDLVINSEDVSFIPQVPIEGQPALITAKIHEASRIKASKKAENRFISQIF